MKYMKICVLTVCAAMVFSACESIKEKPSETARQTSAVSETAESTEKSEQETCAEETSDGSTNETEPEKNYTEIEFSRDDLEETSGEAAGISDFLKETFGSTSAETGFEMSYGTMGKLEFSGQTFYLVSVRWLVEDENGNVTNNSRISELMVSEDRTEVYEAWIDAGDKLLIYDKNLIETEEPWV